MHSAARQSPVPENYAGYKWRGVKRFRNSYHEYSFATRGERDDDVRLYDHYYLDIQIKDPDDEWQSYPAVHN